jgi:hypothetical protein
MERWANTSLNKRDRAYDTLPIAKGPRGRPYRRKWRKWAKIRSVDKFRILDLRSLVELIYRETAAH